MYILTVNSYRTVNRVLHRKTSLLISTEEMAAGSLKSTRQTNTTRCKVHSIFLFNRMVNIATIVLQRDKELTVAKNG